MGKTKFLVQKTESRLGQAHKEMTMRQCDVCYKGDTFQVPWDEVNYSVQWERCSKIASFSQLLGKGTVAAKR